MATPNNQKKRRSRMPGATAECRPSSAEETLEFILGIKLTLWALVGSSIGETDGRKVTNFFLEFRGKPDICPHCGQPMHVKDYKKRVWRHANLDAVACYVHASIPRFECSGCRIVRQTDIPWADENVSYTKRFMEVAIDMMSKMSVRSAAKIMMCSWDTLDNIVDRVVSEYLDRMDLSCVTRIRIDETSAKKHHRYITVVTDVDTGDIIFMTKGKDSDTVKEFGDWLIEHNGDPKQISIVASDFGDAFLSGVREYLPNAESVLDPFHLIQLGNMKLDADRASCQENGERKKSIRYALLRNPENFKPGDAEIVMDIKNDNKGLGLSYEMNMSLRQAFEHPYVELARIHLLHWVEWVEKEGSKNFKALAKTVKRHLEGILNAMRFNINNGYQEGLNGRIQFTKRVANGYHKESRLMRMVFFRESAVRSRG